MTEAQEFMEEGKIDEAMGKLDEVAKLMPENALQVEMQKFGMLLEAKKFDKAYAIATKVVEGPGKDDAMVLNSISWAIVDPEAGIAKPNLDLAFKAAERAVKLSEEKDPAILDTLARCYWLKGEKAKALELQTKAVGLAKGDEYDEEMKAGLQKTLDEYKKDAK
jgi:tetratricopeptide (TPR) repeat protein